MASAPTLPLVSVEEYLSSSWRPDKEYVDGMLVERSMPSGLHSLLQAILIAYFRSFEKDFRIKVLPECRTQIIERARYRVPDVLLATAPGRLGKVMTNPPVAVIEILSPEDKHKDILARFADYERTGVRHMVQTDPETFVAYRYENGSLIRTQFRHLSLPDRPDLPFDSEALFAQLRKEIEEFQGSERRPVSR